MSTPAIRSTNTAAVRQTSAASGPNNPNAILSQYQPTGASARTAAQDGLSAGVGASQKMAQTDLKRLEKYKEAFEAAASKHGLPPALLAAIASRESRAGAVLDSRGRGDGGNGFGLMQIDFRYHTPKGGPYSAEHIDQAAGILKGMLNEVKAKHPDWSAAQQLRGAVAAYNSGVGNVQTLKGMDVGTTGNDYSNDVWARAQALAPHFGGKASTDGTGSTGGTKPAEDVKFPPFDGKYTTAPSLDAVKGGELLHIGHKGESVKQLQKLLGLPTKDQDGVFGPKTRDAVWKFQQEHGLKPPAGKEGMVGPTTLQWLQNGGKAPAKADKPVEVKDGFDDATTGKTKWTAAPSLKEVQDGSKLLKQGMQGPAVKELQTLLGIEADGKFGPGTKKAVEAFQKRIGLKPPPELSGAVGKTTLEKLQKAGAVGDVDMKGAIETTGYRAGKPFKLTVVPVGTDVHGNKEYLRPDAAAAWFKMKEAAARDGVTLRLTDAYRSMETQRDRKRQYGSAAAEPGYSNHQQGISLDIDPSDPKAYNWLLKNSRHFGIIHGDSTPGDLDKVRGERQHFTFRPEYTN